MKSRAQLMHPQQDNCLIDVGGKVIRVESQRTSQAVQGGLVIAELLQRHAQEGIGRARSLIQLHRLLQLGNSIGSLAPIP